jgi:hypothetical protein
MQATTLTFVIVASQVGLATGHISTTTSASLLAAGLLSAAVFPGAAMRLLVHGRLPAGTPAAGTPAGTADQPVTDTTGGASHGHARLSVAWHGINEASSRAWTTVARRPVPRGDQHAASDAPPRQRPSCPGSAPGSVEAPHSPGRIQTADDDDRGGGSPSYQRSECRLAPLTSGWPRSRRVPIIRLCAGRSATGTPGGPARG